MSVVTEELNAPAIEETLERLPGAGTPGPPGGSSGNGGSGDGHSGRGGQGSGRFEAFPISKGRLGMWLLLTGITMLFAGLGSAYIITSGTPWWEGVSLPRLLWANTFILLASSATIERTRRYIQHDQQASARIWIAITGILGLGFLIGQVVAWRQLVDAGVYLQSTLHSSFFYILTGLHGLHLLGGVSALGYIWAQVWRNRYSASRHEPVGLTAMYWHFMDGLWVCVFLLLILV